MRKRTFLRGVGGLALAGAVLPAVVHAQTPAISIEGPEEFQTVIGEALRLLGLIGFGAYVEAVSDVVVARESVPPTVNNPGGYGWVHAPVESGPIRNSVAPINLLWPALHRAAPLTLATLIAHEATHLHQFRRDPAIFLDEVGPTSVQYAVESALLAITS